ncbi:MAG: 50S ribosomal protein L11 methyltransferase, partial [Gemmatimonadales bacterium]
GTLVTFAPDAGSADALLQEIGQAGGGPVRTARRPLDSVDWSVQWRDGLGARRFGRLTVVPSWLPEADQPEPAAVVLDPEMAFGSGEHGSTRAALVLLERLLQPGDTVLDLGSGSGILAIASVKLGAARAVGIENDGEANQVAVRNAERNGVRRWVEFLDGDAGDLAPLLGPADLLLSNILRTINTALLPAVVRALRPGGVAIFAGMEEVEAPLFRSALQAVGLVACDETADAGWWAVAARRP